MLECISNLLKLKESASHIAKMREHSSSEDLSALVRDFEIEADRLNEKLIEEFGDDPEVVQITVELKSAVTALREDNVESDPSIS
jgi:predicted Zn-dependent protease